MEKIICVAGPTASGKTKLSVALAKALNGEVLSCDSMQIYRGMDIGTAAPTLEEMQGVPHHMIGVADPKEDFSVGKYVEQAEPILQDILSRGKTCVVCGGTGLYITSLVLGSDFGGVGKNEAIRNKWKNILADKGKQYIYEFLEKIDPDSAAKISVNDTKRVIRAIEIYEMTGTPKSKLVSENNTKYDAKTVILYDDDRDALYKRINTRVDKMFASGLIDEVESLMKYENCGSMQAIGYKETIEFLKGKISKEEAIEKVKQNSRNYAKRQITYFKGMRIVDKQYVKFNDFAAIFNAFRQI